MGDTFAGIASGGPLLVAVGVAPLAGLVSFLSPCILPLVPGYLSYVTGLAGADLDRRAAPAARRRPRPDPARRRRLHRRLHRGRSRSPAVLARPALGAAPAASHATDQRRGDRRRRRHHRAGPGLPRPRARAAARVAHPAAAGGRPGRRAAARRGVRAVLDPVHRARPSARCWRSPRSTAHGRGRRCWASRTASGLGLPFLVFGLGFRKLLGAAGPIRRNSRWVTRVGGAMLVLVGLALVTGAWADVHQLAASWSARDRAYERRSTTHPAPDRRPPPRGRLGRRAGRLLRAGAG